QLLHLQVAPLVRVEAAEPRGTQDGGELLGERVEQPETFGDRTPLRPADRRLPVPVRERAAVLDRRRLVRRRRGGPGPLRVAVAEEHLSWAHRREGAADEQACGAAHVVLLPCLSWPVGAG